MASADADADAEAGTAQEAAAEAYINMKHHLNTNTTGRRKPASCNGFNAHFSTSIIFFIPLSRVSGAFNAGNL